MRESLMGLTDERYSPNNLAAFTSSTVVKFVDFILNG